MTGISAFVLINTETGKIENVIEDIRKMVDKDPGLEIIYADSTTGKYDIITLIEGDEMLNLHKFIVGELQNVEGITSTITEVVTCDEPLKAPAEREGDVVKSYILGRVEVGKIEDVLRTLGKVSVENSDIIKVSCTTGEYDIIARVESEDIPSLHYFISGKIHGVDGITDTITHIVAKEITS